METYRNEQNKPMTIAQVVERVMKYNEQSMNQSITKPTKQLKKSISNLLRAIWPTASKTQKSLADIKGVVDSL